MLNACILAGDRSFTIVFPCFVENPPNSAAGNRTQREDDFSKICSQIGRRLRGRVELPYLAECFSLFETRDIKKLQLY